VRDCERTNPNELDCDRTVRARCSRRVDARRANGSFVRSVECGGGSERNSTRNERKTDDTTRVNERYERRYLMYYLNDQGERVYTLKVRRVTDKRGRGWKEMRRKPTERTPWTDDD